MLRTQVTSFRSAASGRKGVMRFVGGILFVLISVVVLDGQEVPVEDREAAFETTVISVSGS